MESVTITLPNRPVITMHKGWAPSKHRRNVFKSIPTVEQPCFETHTFSASSRRGASSAAKPPEEEAPLVSQGISTTTSRGARQKFDFVNNACEPWHTKDAAVRKLVRSHVMKEVVRERREQEKARLRNANAQCKKARGANELLLQSERPTDEFLENSVMFVTPARDQSTPCTPTRPEIDYCFANYLSRIQAKIHRLESLYFPQVGSAVFPIEFHLAYDPPTQLLSLDPSFINNEVIFQSLMYAAAVCSTLQGEQGHSRDIIAQMNLTIWLINKLLDGGMWMADGVLGAVCHLAMGEAIRGNLNDWSIHMTGLKKMVAMRGGMDRVHSYLRMKLHRADLLGSVDQVSRPFFDFRRSDRPTLHTNPSLPPHDTPLNQTCVHTRLRALLPQLADVLTEVGDFSKTIEQTLLMPETRLDPKVFIEAWYSIQYQLLSSELVEDVPDGAHIPYNKALGESFRLGAIIYMKEILREFTFSASGSRGLVSKLKISLGTVLTSEFAPSLSSLLLWLLFMGGMASVENNMNHIFFTAHLVRLRQELGIYEWEDVRDRLESVLWIGRALDKAGKDLWEKVGLAWRVLRP